MTLTNKNRYVLAAALLIVGSALSLHAFAQSAPAGQPPMGMGFGGFHGGMMGNHAPGVMGTVTAISGDTITLTAQQHQWQQPGSASVPPTTAPTVTTYTVNATSTTVVTKAGVASTLSAIAVGDKIMVQGTVSGTNVAATKINDGFAPRSQNGAGGKPNLLASFTGNGQPIIGGTVSAVNGTSITLTNSSGTSYTVDASNAKFTVGGVTTPTIANVVAGDSILVQGTINGTSVTATTVLDNGQAPAAGSSSAAGTPPANGGHPGFFGSIGGFFKKLFGF